MKNFDGFPLKMSFTPIPNIFINQLLPEIEDIGELKVTLYIMEAVYNKKGYPRFVSFGELMENGSLVSSLNKPGCNLEDVIKKALQKALERKTIIGLSLEDGTGIYFLNTESDRQAAEKIKSGELKVTGIKAGTAAAIKAEEPVNIFVMYEKNIGMLTPMVAEELKDIINLYPENWIGDAIKEAVKQNARKLSYITAILERRAKEGRSDGTYRQHFEENDPNKYTSGKYGRFVQH